MKRLARAMAGVAITAVAAASTGSARADLVTSGTFGEPSDGATEDWAIHGQSTLTEQFHPAFKSPYRGPNSLDPGSRGDETFDATIFAGVRPWSGAEIWFNGEIDQGFGLSDTLGIAAFPSGEAYKIGKAVPYPKIPRVFLRQTIDLGGETQTIDPDINQLGGTQTANRLVFTIGKFAVPDVFDHNAYADDARNNFLNWTLVDLGTFDYAANAWGYTYGATIEWYQDRWTLRAGAFDLSNVPNSARLEEVVGRQFEAVTELEERHTLWDRAGSVRFIAFFNHGRMGDLSDAIALSQLTGQPPNVALVRHMHERAGFGITGDQQLTDDLGFFWRAGYDDPSKEPFEFIDVDTALSAGFSLTGDRWGRKDDTVGLAFIVDSITKQHAAYFNAGGLGILIGDGKLPHPGDEEAMEASYKYAPYKWLAVTADYQLVINPAYNRDRGPVSILGTRLHVQF